MTKEEEIVKLKCEIFDIMREQELLNNKFNELQNIKILKAQELNKLEIIK